MTFQEILHTCISGYFLADVKRGFLMNPLSGEVYFCKEKKR